MSQIRSVLFSRQKGIAQIFILAIMAVLAIALPVTTKLVQQSQETRSSAAAKKCTDFSASDCPKDKGCSVIEVPPVYNRVCSGTYKDPSGNECDRTSDCPVGKRCNMATPRKCVPDTCTWDRKTGDRMCYMGDDGEFGKGIYVCRGVTTVCFKNSDTNCDRNGYGLDHSCKNGTCRALSNSSAVCTCEDKVLEDNTNVNKLDGGKSTCSKDKKIKYSCTENGTLKVDPCDSGRECVNGSCQLPSTSTCSSNGGSCITGASGVTIGTSCKVGSNSGKIIGGSCNEAGKVCCKPESSSSCSLSNCSACTISNCKNGCKWSGDPTGGTCVKDETNCVKQGGACGGTARMCADEGGNVIGGSTGCPSGQVCCKVGCTRGEEGCECRTSSGTQTPPCNSGLTCNSSGKCVKATCDGHANGSAWCKSGKPKKCENNKIVDIDSSFKLCNGDTWVGNDDGCKSLGGNCIDKDSNCKGDWVSNKCLSQGNYLPDKCCKPSGGGTKVDGVCSTTEKNKCTSGDYDSSPADTSTDYLWTCKGKNGGKTVSNCKLAKPVCTNGQQKCVTGNKYVTCTNGQWGTSQTACASRKTCTANQVANDVCVAPASVCTNGQQKCVAGNKYITCTNGQWGTSQTACASGKTCTANQVANDVCVASTSTVPSIGIKFTFAGVKANAKCIDDIEPIKLLVGNVPSMKVQELTADVSAAEGEKNAKNDQVFQTGLINLDGTKFDRTNTHNYVRAKGYLHARMKFCVNNQKGKTGDGSCNMLFNGTVYSFIDYPILPGDVTGETVGQQNGVINSQDYSYIKTRVINDDGEESCGKEGDLNLDGIVNGIDIQLIKNSLGARDDD